MNVTVFGLGKLGCPFAAVVASGGHTVFCVDTNTDFLHKLAKGNATVDETGLQDLVTKHGGSMIPVASSPHEAVAKSQYVFIVVPTPTKHDGSFSSTFIEETLHPIAKAIAGGAGPCVVVTCTTSPGTMDNVVVARLEELSGKQCGVHFSVAYNPAFIALGSVVRNLQRPDYVLLGGNTPDATDDLETFYRHIYKTINEPVPPIAKMTLVNAELCKLATNCYITMKISWANAMGRLCEYIPGADAHVICAAVGNDSRIGPKYIQPGGPYGGPCFPRDNGAICAAGPMPLAVTANEINRSHTEALIHLVTDASPNHVAILGMSYKPDTAVTTESLGVAIVERLIAKGIPYSIFDTETLSRDNLIAADFVVVTTASEQYRSLTVDDFQDGAIILDVWGIMPRPIQRTFSVITPGRYRDRN